MRFERVRLSNFKCYGDADLRLNAGVTVIHGLNGSGKSSLLEACFFALYGSKALDNTLDEVVTIGADDAEVELTFSHAGGTYDVRRRVRATGERATTAECVLETPESTIEGARDVRAYVEDLLRMDAEAFVNCAYVRQGEVNKLINASPGERQDMLDSLLQLGKLEDYRERASDARVGVGRVRDDKRGALSQVEEQVEAKEEKDLHDRLNDLRTEHGEVAAEIERFEDQRETAVETRDRAAEILETYEEKREELADLESDIEDLREQISETERNREDLAESVSEKREAREERRGELADLLSEADLEDDSGSQIDADRVVDDPELVEERLDALAEADDDLQSSIESERVEATEHASQAESLRESADDLESQAAEKREQADDLEADVAETRETLAERREKIDELEERIESLEAEFEDAPVAFGEAESFREDVSEELSEVREAVAGLESDVENQREAIAEAEALLDAGKCPECGQDVDGAPHVETLDDDRHRLAELEAELEERREEQSALEERLERVEELVDRESEVREARQNRSTFEQLVAEQAETLEEKAEQVEELQMEAEELDEEAAEKRESAAEHESAAESCRERVAEINQERQTLRERRERLDRVEDLVDAIADAGEAIERLRERRDHLEETNDERRGRLAEKRDRRSVLREEFDEDRVEEAREQRDNAVTYIEKADAKLESLRERRDELQAAIGGVENEIEELESLRERREELAATVERLDSLYEETRELQDLYGDLRAELRRRNVDSLEAMLNEIFDLVYQNDSYARIELSGEYELTVYQKDGETLDPEQLSGGERALFNLSLRCAIYRLLAEGIEGSAPMPPLILDEPTVFLDSGHVSQLVELVDAMGAYGVEQILVVSHDEELVGAADDLVRVRKDATSNRSTVERETPQDRLLEAD